MRTCVGRFNAATSTSSGRFFGIRAGTSRVDVDAALLRLPASASAEPSVSLPSVQRTMRLPIPGGKGRRGQFERRVEARFVALQFGELLRAGFRVERALNQCPRRSSVIGLPPAECRRGSGRRKSTCRIDDRPTRSSRVRRSLSPRRSFFRAACFRRHPRARACRGAFHRRCARAARAPAQRDQDENQPSARSTAIVICARAPRAASVFSAK